MSASHPIPASQSLFPMFTRLSGGVGYISQDQRFALAPAGKDEWSLLRGGSTAKRARGTLDTMTVRHLLGVVALGQTQRPPENLMDHWERMAATQLH